MENVSTDHLNEMINRSTDSVLITTMEGKVLYFNAGAETIFGIKREDIIGKSVKKIDPQFDPQALLKEFEDPSTVNLRFDWEHQTADGDSKWLDVNLSFLIDPETEKPIGFMGISKDISERIKQKEELELINQKLSLEEFKFRTIFEDSETAIGIYNEDGTLLDVNPMSLKIMDVASKEDLIGYNFFSDPTLSEDQKNDLINGKTLDIEVRVNYADFEKRNRINTRFEGIKYFHSIITPVTKNFEGLNIGYIVQMTDITTMVSQRNKLKEANAKLKKLNEELDHFVYSSSHNLRAPISSVMGLVTLLREEVDTKDGHHYISLIEKTLKNLDEVILDINNYGKNERLAIDKESITLKPFLEEIYQQLANMENASRISLQIEIEPKLTLVSDLKRLKMIFHNIFSNAIKYQDLEKESPLIRVSCKVEKKYQKITVEDNGIGISKKGQQKLFTMFYRATELGAGSGLGLYIVKQAMQNLNGDVKLTSAKGEGTSIELLFPKEN